MGIARIELATVLCSGFTDQRDTYQQSPYSPIDEVGLEPTTVASSCKQEGKRPLPIELLIFAKAQLIISGN